MKTLKYKFGELMIVAVLALFTSVLLQDQVCRLESCNAFIAFVVSMQLFVAFSVFLLYAPLSGILHFLLSRRLRLSIYAPIVAGVSAAFAATVLFRGDFVKDPLLWTPVIIILIGSIGGQVWAARSGRDSASPETRP